MEDLVSAEVIFPMSGADFDSGKGLSVTVLASQKAKDAFEGGAGKGMLEVVMDSDALAQIGLNKGVILPVELHDGKQPAVPWGFAKKYR